MSDLPRRLTGMAEIKAAVVEAQRALELRAAARGDDA
jgi:hypothetical protein